MQTWNSYSVLYMQVALGINLNSAIPRYIMAILTLLNRNSTKKGCHMLCMSMTEEIWIIYVKSLTWSQTREQCPRKWLLMEFLIIFPQISHHSNVVMEALRVSVLDIDGKKFMFDKMREHLKFSPSMPDGHCFLYSVIKACSTQLAPNLNIEVESILDKMHSELATCPNVYTAFTEGKDIGEMTSAFDDYVLY